MKVLNEIEYASWKTKNTDPYSARVFSYAEDWASKLEADLEAAPNLSVAEVIAKYADARSDEANYDGITGFMHGAACNILAHCWVHGEALRRWHNKTTQLHTEGDEANENGGVLNPAILTVGPK